ncbi:MAG: hypothetical protein GTN81_09810 [Proteobacteria bacterium]|nr:hypothetical protein [Pseudomonadota bacterium]
METEVRSPGKKRYRVFMIKEDDPKTRYIDFVWATSASEAEQIIENKKGKTGEKILKIRATAIR